MPAMPAAPSDQFVGNSNLHEPFLRRAADATDGHTSGVALGGFLTLRLVDVFDRRFETLSAEALAYQVQATRDYLADLNPSTVEVKHLIGIVRAAQSAFEQRNRRLLWPSLLAFAFWLEQELRLDEALDVLDAAMALSDGVEAEEEIATLLQRARVLRLSGRLDAAAEGYAAAGRLAMTCGDTHSELLSRIGYGIVLQKRGNLPESVKVLSKVLSEAKAAGDQDATARASHDLAVAYYFMEKHAEGIPLAFSAFELHEQEAFRLRALSDLGLLLKGINQLGAADDAFQIVRHRSHDRGVVTNAANELMDLASLRGDRVGYERWRRSAEVSIETLPPDIQADYLLKAGQGCVRFGDKDLARKYFARCIEIAEQHQLNQFLFQAEQAISLLGKLKPVLPDAQSTDPSDDGKIAAVASRLHELCEQSVG